MTREEIEEGYDEVMFADGFDDCVIGICDRFGQPPIVAYDYNKVIAKLVDAGMSEEEAVEHFQFNIIGAWVGELTPCWVTL